MMHNVDGSNVSANEVVKISPGEGQLPLWLTSEPDSEALLLLRIV